MTNDSDHPLGAAPVPDIQGHDLRDEGSDDPILSAKALAAAIEAENAGRINKLIAQGAHPLSIQIGIVQTGLEEIINLIPIPPLLRAQFEVACETAIAAYLDKVQSELTRHRLLEK